jgi:hypothetical protein
VKGKTTCNPKSTTPAASIDLPKTKQGLRKKGKPVMQVAPEPEPGLAEESDARDSSELSASPSNHPVESESELDLEDEMDSQPLPKGKGKGKGKQPVSPYNLSGRLITNHAIGQGKVSTHS